MTILRHYERWQCLGDGYPEMWHGCLYCHASGKVEGVPCATCFGAGSIKNLIRERAGNRCLRCHHPYPVGIAETHPRGEWTPCDDLCTHGGPTEFDYLGPDSNDLDGERWGVLAQWRILTVHHLDEDKSNCRWWNLAALCQRCHLRMQRAVVMDRTYHFEHSEWFKPFAAGFYAWKYEGVDLTREEVTSRLDELLAYEHRWTQEALV